MFSPPTAHVQAGLYRWSLRPHRRPPEVDRLRPLFEVSLSRASLGRSAPTTGTRPSSPSWRLPYPPSSRTRPEVCLRLRKGRTTLRSCTATMDYSTRVYQGSQAGGWEPDLPDGSGGQARKPISSSRPLNQQRATLGPGPNPFIHSTHHSAHPAFPFSQLSRRPTCLKRSPNLRLGRSSSRLEPGRRRITRPRARTHRLSSRAACSRRSSRREVHDLGQDRVVRPRVSCRCGRSGRKTRRASSEPPRWEVKSLFRATCVVHHPQTDT